MNLAGAKALTTENTENTERSKVNCFVRSRCSFLHVLCVLRGSIFRILHLDGEVMA